MNEQTRKTEIVKLIQTKKTEIVKLTQTKKTDTLTSVFLWMVNAIDVCCFLSKLLTS